MTDQPPSKSQPSMEDILASIRRIIDTDDDKTVEIAGSSETVEKPADQANFSVDEEAAALARAEYDAAMGRASEAADMPDPAEEEIFPQREGALWRRVAGHPLSEGETDPLAADDTFELTEVLDQEASEATESPLELNELLESSDDSTPDETDRVLEEMLAGSPGNVSSEPAPDESSPSLGIGAMTAAGVVGAGALGGGAMDRITGSFSNERSTPDETPAFAEDEDEILDLTRRIDSDGTIDELASTMGESPVVEDDDLPPPVFERVDVEPFADTEQADQEVLLDQSFETVAVTGSSEDFADAPENADDDLEDARERALDERFYASDDFAEMPPEISSSFTESSTVEPSRAADEGAPTEDEMETVGGLVRDALRARLPSDPSDREEDALVSGGAEESAARSLAALARYDAQAPRRIYGGIKITDDEDSPTIEGVVQDTLRPMLREWLNDNLPTLVENMVKQEVDRISARSRHFVRDDND